MNGSGDQVFGDNIDDILSEKIISHTDLSETENNSQRDFNNKKSSQKPIIITISILLVFSFIIYTVKKSLSKI